MFGYLKCVPNLHEVKMFWMCREKKGFNLVQNNLLHQKEYFAFVHVVKIILNKIQMRSFRWVCCTVPLKCKLPPSREARLVSLETRLVSLETSLVSLEKFLVSLECTASTNTLPLGECTNGIIEKWLCAQTCIHVGIASFVLLAKRTVCNHDRWHACLDLFYYLYS